MQHLFWYQWEVGNNLMCHPLYCCEWTTQQSLKDTVSLQPKNYDYDTYVPTRKYRNPLSTSDEGSLSAHHAAAAVSPAGAASSGFSLAPPKQVRTWMMNNEDG